MQLSFLAIGEFSNLESAQYWKGMIPQSGLSQILSTGRYFLIAERRAAISWTLGTRGEWIS
jgi:hypothetical protein